MERVTVVLGAGASRGVKYAHLGQFPSPLDGDYFDLLQRLKPNEKDLEAVNFVLKQASLLPPDFRRSMERTFYTLHLRSLLRRKLSGSPDKSEEARIVGSFAHATEALLRESHGKLTCDYHRELVMRLKGDDAIISFNYDLVIDRALRPFAEGSKVEFGGQIYCFEGSPEKPLPIPRIIKLHGSSNWRLTQDGFSTGNSWTDFDDRPWYLRQKLKGTEFPIFLPFWDKDIEDGPWLHLWKRAHFRLQGTAVVLVWGYSLPPTDVKARELFSISVAESGANIKLCVIAPSSSTRQRWRDLYPRAQFWEYERITQFIDYPPPWWSERPAKRSKI